MSNPLSVSELIGLSAKFSVAASHMGTAVRTLDELGEAGELQKMIESFEVKSEILHMQAMNLKMADVALPAEDTVWETAKPKYIKKCNWCRVDGQLIYVETISFAWNEYDEDDIYISGLTRKGSKWEQVSFDFLAEDYNALEIVKE